MSVLSGKKIILFELNEVPYFILEDYVKRHPASAFSTILETSKQYETFTEDAGHLSPWVTWPSLHRGVNDEKHNLSDINQDTALLDKQYPPIWQLLQKSGINTGVFGSLQSYKENQSLSGYSFYVPDTFAVSPECYPDYLTSFQDFNLRMARESGKNVSQKIDMLRSAKMLLNLPQLGLKFSTLFDVGKQLVHERINQTRKTRRRTYQSVLGFDVFMKLVKRKKPEFCSFFTNHIASAMHRYWAASYPQHYQKVDFTGAWIKDYKHEIDFSMQKADGFLKQLLTFVNKHTDYSLWICSSMGQAATEAIVVETMLYLTKPAKFMQALQMPDNAWEFKPAMVPQCNFKVNLENRNYFIDQLRAILIDGKPLAFSEREPGFFRLDLGQTDGVERISHIHFHGQPIALQEAGFEHLRVEDKVGVTAYHIPQGCLLIYDPEDLSRKNSSQRHQISTLDIAPALLANFNIPIPGYMKDTSTNILIQRPGI